MNSVLNNEITVEIATTFSKRLFGLMGKKKPITKGICFPNCNSIHTFFMRQRIDVIMTDKNQTVLYLFPNLSKNKIILPKRGVYYTYELPLSSIEKIKIGDTLTLEKQ